MNFKRMLGHLWMAPRAVRRAFPAEVMERITGAIRASERQHRGQVRFAVESALDWDRLVQGTQARERALELFAQLGVWDTAENNGVLIYLLLADRDVEIVADRGVHQRVGAEGWERICRGMEQSFAVGRFEEGVRQGVAAVTELLTREYPAAGEAVNELPDEPVVVR